MSEFWAHLDFDGMRGAIDKAMATSAALQLPGLPAAIRRLDLTYSLGGLADVGATVSDEITLGATKAVDGLQAIPVIYDSMSPARRREVALRAAALLVTTLYYLKALMERKNAPAALVAAVLAAAWLYASSSRR